MRYRLFRISKKIRFENSDNKSEVNNSYNKLETGLLSMIVAFQIWGGFWLLSGLLIIFCNRPDFEGIKGNLILSFIFLSPLVVLTVWGRKMQKSNK